MTPTGRLSLRTAVWRLLAALWRSPRRRRLDDLDRRATWAAEARACRSLTEQDAELNNPHPTPLP